MRLKIIFDRFYSSLHHASWPSPALDIFHNQQSLLQPTMLFIAFPLPLVIPAATLFIIQLQWLRPFTLHQLSTPFMQLQLLRPCMLLQLFTIRQLFITHQLSITHQSFTKQSTHLLLSTKRSSQPHQSLFIIIKWWKEFDDV